MNQKELISTIASEANLTKTDVQAVLDGLRTAVAGELAAGNAVTLRNFVKFSPKVVPAVPKGKRKNPFTGEMKMQPAKPARTKAKVSALKTFDDAITAQ